MPASVRRPASVYLIAMRRPPSRSSGSSATCAFTTMHPWPRPRGSDRFCRSYVLEPGFWREPDASGRHLAFLCESLAELREALAALGQPLIVRVGEVEAVLEDLRQHHPIGALRSHEETGNGWTYARDRRVRAWAATHGIPWHERRQTGVIRRLARRDGWARQWDQQMRPATGAGTIAADGGAWNRRGVTPALEHAGPGARPVPRAAARRPRRGGGDPAQLPRRARPALPQGDVERPPPVRSTARACRRISPGAPSPSARPCRPPRLAWPALAPDERRGLAGSLASFVGRLRWHCHFIQKLESEPRDRVALPSIAAYEGLRGSRRDASRRLGRGPHRLAVRRRLHAHAARHGLAELPHARDGDERGLLPALAGLARRPACISPACSPTTSPASTGRRRRCSPAPPASTAIRIYNPIKQGLDHDPGRQLHPPLVPRARRASRSRWLHTPWLLPAMEQADAALPPSAATIRCRWSTMPQPPAHARDAIWAVRRRARLCRHRRHDPGAPRQPPQRPAAAGRERQGRRASSTSAFDMPRMRRKADLPALNGPIRNRPFVWRSRWARDSERVIFSSERCRRRGPAYSTAPSPTRHGCNPAPPAPAARPAGSGS